MKTRRRLFHVVVQCSVAAVLANFSFAASPPDQQIQAHLAAGEFGPAIRQAGRLAEGRNAWLGRIAIAQARTGAKSASHATLRQIDDDRELAYVTTSLREDRNESAGGASMADFDSLIELIVTTVAPDSWDEVGGPGSIVEFAGGVYVDAQGVLRRLRDQVGHDDASIDQRRLAAQPSELSQTDPHRPSDLRMISLTRLARELKIRHAFGEPPTRTMQHLAGLRKIRFVFVYRDSGDLVIAGPAGDWQRDREGIAIGSDRRPVLLLDDLVVLLRNAYQSDGRFGCSITPKRDNLARTRQFLSRPQRPLKPHQTPRWIEQVRNHLGLQNVEVYGVDPHSHAARVLVEADYHMKLIGMGLEPGVPGLTNYLDSIELRNAPPTMDVLRWWFTLRENSITRNREGNAFALSPWNARLQSENELISVRGDRIQTGKSSELNQAFADRFTTHYAALANKYPLYAELDNLFQLALVTALVQKHQLDAMVGWDPEWLLDATEYQPQQGEVPREVPSVVNHRVINRKHIVAGVSGGISVNSYAVLGSTRILSDARSLESDKDVSRPTDNRHATRWWWD